MARIIDQIVVHHSASPAKTTTVEDIDRWHKERGFKKIGYHYVIHHDGSVHIGRAESEVGAHLKRQNRHSLGICIAGNFEEEHPLPAQLKSLETLLLELFERYPEAEFTWHKRENLAQTLCPGKNIIGYLETFKEKVQR